VADFSFLATMPVAFVADFWGHRHHSSYSTSTLLSTPPEIFVADFSFVATMPVEFVTDFWGSQAQLLFNLNLAYHPINNCG
jgi:hypothetical protein